MKSKIQIIISILMALICTDSIAQVTQLNTIRPASPAFNGWDGTGPNPGSLQIRNNFDDLIEFHTNNLQRMTILGGPVTNGFVGIGSNLTTYTPLFNLDVLSTINVNNDGNPLNALGIGYYIGGNMVLQIPGIHCKWSYC